MHTTVDVWAYREGALPPEPSPADVIGYDVEARDGSIGNVEDARYDDRASYVVVDTGPWIFGKKVMLPAGVIRSVDHEGQKVFVDRTKDEIKNAPELDDSLLEDEGYRGRLGSYYGPGGPGHRDRDDR